MADLVLGKTVSNAAPYMSQTVTYTVTLSNAGPSNATSIQVYDLLPGGLSYVSASASQGSYDPGSGAWWVGDVFSGAGATLQIQAAVATSGAITNSASITSFTETDPNVTNNSASATINATGLTALDLISLCSNNPGAYRVWQVSNPNPIPVTFTWEILGGGPTGSNTASAWGSVVFTTPTQGGTNNMRILVAGSQQDSDNSNSTPCSADLAAGGWVSNATPTEGSTIVFTLTITNNGPDAATGIQATDLLPAGLTYVSHITPNGSYFPASGLWWIGSLNSGAAVTLSLTASVNAGTVGTTITDSIAITYSDVFDANAGNNSSSIPITVN
jgi:uncharacterized repeat protein (TIGR01451 family)